MGEGTIIAWTDFTANFWQGCTKVSAGCAHCYAESLTKNRMGLDVWGPNKPRKPVAGVWENVRKWNREAERSGDRKLVFVMSLGDFFEDDPVANEIRPRAWDLIRRSEWLDFQLLTKRPERIAANLPADWRDGWPNVWLGTSIEDMRVAARADHLRTIPASVRFVSYEPALGPLDDLNLDGIDWMIYGGESGPGFRPHDLAWPRRMRERCSELGVAFFFKQSSAPRTEMGTTLDGETVRKYPRPRIPIPCGRIPLERAA